MLLADTKLKRKLSLNFFPKTVAQHDPVFATLRLRGRPGRDGCQTALWDCFGGRIFNMAANSSPNTVPPGLQRNLKVGNSPQSSLDEGK